MRIKEKNIYNLEKEKKDINNNKMKPPPKKNRYENYRTLIARQDDYVRKQVGCKEIINITYTVRTLVFFKIFFSSSL